MMNPEKVNRIIKLGSIILFLLSFLFADTQAQSHSVHRSDGHTKIHYKDDDKEFKVEYEGEITLSSNDRDIVAITPGGYIDISKSSFGSKRRVVIEADGPGKLKKEYYVGRKEQAWTSGGQAWLAEVLPELVRTTTIGAKQRVDRIYAASGAKGVLNEIKQLDGDHPKHGYTSYLLEKNLNDGEKVEVIETISSSIDSDHYLSDILKKNHSSFLATTTLTTAFIKASKTLDSDHYKTDVLKKVADRNLTDSQMPLLLEMIGDIESDHYITDIVKDLLRNQEMTKTNLDKIIQMAKYIESDHYRSDVLKSTFNAKNFNSPNMAALLALVDDIESDHYTTEVVLKLFDYDMKDADLEKLSEIINRNVESDHYKSTIITRMVKGQKIEGRALDLIIEGIGYMDSDNYKLDIIQSISRKGEITNSSLLVLLKAVGNFNSDHYKADALKSLASKTRNSTDAAKQAYRDAARTIDSEHYYGRALKALDR